MTYAGTQFIAYLLLAGRNVSQQLLTLLAGKDAELGGADAQVRRYLHTCHTDHRAVHGTGLLLEDDAQFLLQQTGNFVLSCFLHSRYVFILVCQGGMK